MISNQTIAVKYPLLQAPGSLWHLSRINRKEIQKDGWGIGWFENGRPHIIKSPKPIYKDLSNGVRQNDVRRNVVSQNAVRLNAVHSRCLIGHVRWASNPLKLPKDRLIGLNHTQPFTFQSWIFAHNGTLLIPKEVRAHLGSLDKHIRGNNDSEVLFYWLLKYLHQPLARGGSAGIVSAIRKSLKRLDAIWNECRKRYPLYKYPYHGVNWVLTNGKILVAMCYVNPAGFGKSKALGRRGDPYYQLRYRKDSEGWTVASEPLDDDPRWKSFSHGQVLIANAKSGRFWPLKV
jgi:glutamine amidotransferase